MLDGQFPESREPAEREPLDAVYAVVVESQFAQVSEAVESVAGQVSQIVFGQRQVFD